MIKEKLEKNLNLLNIISGLNDNKYSVNIIKQENFNNEFLINQLLGIAKNKNYFYYLNNTGYNNLLKIVVCLNDEKLINEFNYCLNNFNKDKISVDYQEINDKKILFDFNCISKKLMLTAEKDLLNYLLGKKEIVDKTFALPYVIVSLINKNYGQINIYDVNKLLELLTNVNDIEYFQVYDYLNINYINDLYTDTNIETLDFYYIVVNIFNELKINNNNFYDQNNNLISSSFICSEKVIIEDDILKIIPNIINVIVSSSHFCYCLTEDNLKTFYEMINFYRFNYLKDDEQKFVFCNKVIGKLNNLREFLNVFNKEDYKDKELKSMFDKELLDVTNLADEKLIKVNNFDPKKLYDVYIADQILLMYLTNPTLVNNNPILNKFLYYHPTVDLAILYLLNRHINILNKEIFALLKDLIIKRINNRSEIKYNNKDFKYKSGYVKVLKYVSRFIDERIEF